MKNNIYLFFLMFISASGYSQTHDFKTVIDIETTDVISQGNTGTCWSFSTSSFLESEITRLTGKTIDLSEMYNVRHTYPTKAWNYVMRQGKTQFSEGGLAHDVINSVKNHGIVPNQVYSGLINENKIHDHSKLIDTLKQTLNNYLKDTKAYKSDWKQDIDAILDSSLGGNISYFNYEGVQYTPNSFLKMTKINPDEYISITSFSHRPFNSQFILNIPDNFSNGLFFNVALDQLVAITNYALEKGFTIELDCDVSEKTFSSKNGLAIIPEVISDDIFKALTQEK